MAFINILGTRYRCAGTTNFGAAWAALNCIPQGFGPDNVAGWSMKLRELFLLSRGPAMVPVEGHPGWIARPFPADGSAALFVPNSEILEGQVADNIYGVSWPLEEFVMPVPTAESRAKWAEAKARWKADTYIDRKKRHGC